MKILLPTIGVALGRILIAIILILTGSGCSSTPGQAAAVWEATAAMENIADRDLNFRKARSVANTEDGRLHVVELAWDKGAKRALLLMAVDPVGQNATPLGIEAFGNRTITPADVRTLAESVEDARSPWTFDQGA